MFLLLVNEFWNFGTKATSYSQRPSKYVPSRVCRTPAKCPVNPLNGLVSLPCPRGTLTRQRHRLSGSLWKNSTGGASSLSKRLMEKPFGEPHSCQKDKQSHLVHLLRRRPTAGLEGLMENLLAKVSTRFVPKVLLEMLC